jgi:hypothetical protein
VINFATLVINLREKYEIINESVLSNDFFLFYMEEQVILAANDGERYDLSFFSKSNVLRLSISQSLPQPLPSVSKSAIFKCFHPNSKSEAITVLHAKRMSLPAISFRYALYARSRDIAQRLVRLQIGPITGYLLIQP